MFSSYNNFRTARGLSLLLVLLLLAAPAMARQVEPTMGQEFEQAAKEHLGSLKLPAAALVVADATGTRTYYAQGMKPDSSLPLGRIGELFVALLALKQVETGKLRLSDSANDFLDGYGIQADYGEITVRNLLERSSGLPLRESSLYVSEARKVPTFKNLLIQDLKPAVLPPGQAISQHSFGDVLLAEITSVQGKAPLPDQIQKQILQPLGMKDVRLPDPKAKDLSLSGYDSEGFPFRRLKASAHELHDWQARPEAIGSLLKALLGKSPKVVTPAMQKRLLSRSLKLNPGLPTSSLGLLESSLHGHRYFYLDSNWFGETARLAVFPDKGQAFFLAYDTSHPGLKDDWTETFVQSLGAGSIAKLQTKSAGSGLSPSGQWSYFRANSDSNSILKVLDLFRSAKVILSGEQLAQELVVESDNGVFQGKVLSEDLWQESKTGHIIAYPAWINLSANQAEDKTETVPENDELSSRRGIVITRSTISVQYELPPISDESSLEFGFGDHATFRPASNWEKWQTQLALAIAFCLLFLSVLIRTVRFLYEYEPVLETFQEPAEGSPVAAPESSTDLPESASAEALLTAEPTEPETPHASLDIPMAATISSFLALTFTAGIYPVMLFADRVGDHLGLVLRNEPSGWLIAWLAMPLIALITALILLALLAAHWKIRPWGRLEKLHYLVLALGVPLWAAWLTSWNLLGFRF